MPKKNNFIKTKLEWYRAAKAEASCISCGEDEDCCIEFHHIDEKQKVDTISRMVRNKTPFEKLRAEMDKCVPLCSNCHKKVHADILIVLTLDFNRYAVTKRKDPDEFSDMGKSLSSSPQYPFH